MTKRDNKGLWQPGQSANPGGRPAELKEVRELARSHTATAIETLARICTDIKAPPAAQVAAAEAILNRGWGRPTQAVAFEDSEGNRVAPPTVHMVFVDAKPEVDPIDRLTDDDEHG